MRIKSDFHDYYDIALKHGGDDVLFVRKRKVIIIEDLEFDLPLFGFLHSNMKSNKIEYSYSEGVIFCGKFYPIIWSAKEGYLSFDKSKSFCPEKQFMEIKTRGGYGLIPRAQNKIRDLSYVDFTDLHRELGSPIIWVGFYPGVYWSPWQRKETLIINPTLRKVEFQKVKDPYTAFQDIDFFFSNFMGKMPEMVTLSNEDRLEKHGFDKKTSFRKDKTKKKTS